MRFLSIFLVVVFLFGSIDNKIKTTKQTLKYTQTRISDMNSQLDIIVNKINRSEIYLNNINIQIDKLNNQILTLQKRLRNKNRYLNKLGYKKNVLFKKKEKLELKLLDFLSNNYYLQNAKIMNENDLINDEILKAVTKLSAQKMSKLTQTYSDLQNQINIITKIINDIKNSKIILQKRKQELASLKIQQKNKLSQLNQIKYQYKKELQKIIANQNKLQEQLSKLNIIKTTELKKQRELARKALRREKELAKTRERNRKIDKVKVKNYGNIYMKTKTIKYRGRKTIPPLYGKVVKKFGAYMDPVYHISLYNDSITIKAKPNSKVRAIFSGRVVFVGNTSDGKIIVIKHRNKLHSIYAKLSRISPFIKKGYRVKKGEVIAKIDDELEFEITYKTLPINPMKVISFK